MVSELLQCGVGPFAIQFECRLELLAGALVLFLAEIMASKKVMSGDGIAVANLGLAAVIMFYVRLKLGG